MYMFNVALKSEDSLHQTDPIKYAQIRNPFELDKILKKNMIKFARDLDH